MIRAIRTFLYDQGLRQKFFRLGESAFGVVDSRQAGFVAVCVVNGSV